MKHTVKDVLHMAGHLLADPTKHNVFWFAADTHGSRCQSDDPQACRWCFWGAISACSKALGVALFELYELPPGLQVDPGQWDNATRDERLEMARKLMEA